MKQHVRIGLSVALAGVLCGLTSCEKEPLSKAQATPDTAAISKASYAEQVAYTHKHLGVLGKALLLLQKDERIRGLMYAEFDACKPGLENVLFKTLIEKAAAQGIDLEAEMNRALAAAGVKETATNGLLAFKDIEGVTWQPQIYIPNYAALKKTLKLNVKKRMKAQFSSLMPESRV